MDKIGNSQESVLLDRHTEGPSDGIDTKAYQQNIKADSQEVANDARQDETRPQDEKLERFHQDITKLLNQVQDLKDAKTGLIENEEDQFKSPEESAKELQEKPKSILDKVQESFYNGPYWFQQFRDKFSTTLNGFGIAFNFLSVIASNSKIFNETTVKMLDKNSELFSKFVVPASFAWNGVEALVGKRVPEALSRFIPAVSFMFLPFYNLNIATGISSGLNYLFEHVKDRHGGKNPGKTIMENLSAVSKTSFDIFSDMIQGKTDKEDAAKQLATVGLLGGSIGGMFFARNERDSILARLFGNVRNIGGILADWKLIFNDVKNDPRRAFDLRLVGSLCSVASMLNILMRWVDPKLARTLNHIAIAIDDFGLTYWAQRSKKENDVAMQASLKSF